MKTVPLLIIMALLVLSANAQDATRDIINDVVRNFQDTGTVVYVSEKYDFDGARGTMLTGNLIGIDQEARQKLTLKLSHADKNILKKQFRHFSKGNWPPGYITNSRPIGKDSLNKFLSDERRRFSFFSQEFGPGYFSISDPVFIRNNSFAMVHLSRMVAYDGGYDWLYIYKKYEGKWKRYMLVSIGAW